MRRHIGDELRAAREAAGMTQSHLGYVVGISREYVSILENGHQSPTVDTLFALCKALRVKPSNLIRHVKK